ncbi:MAG: hypothetical protein EOO09_16815 [Chitinophagaceae bacterium]|nr:MAG: hypothetical protein EOO09_16815 [Chitinophagaceae bacterium]
MPFSTSITRLIPVFLLVIVVNTSSAQFSDSLKASVGFTGTAASEEYQPLWSSANRNGTINDRKVDLSTYLRFSNKHRLFSKDSAGERPRSGLNVDYALEVYNNDQFNKTFLGLGFLRLEKNGWSLIGGRYIDNPSRLDQTLSSGSLGISTNALPIPRVGIAVTEFKNIPLTNGWLQFKGSFSHGWMGSDRYLDSWLHEKSFFLRVGKRKLKLYGGLQHFAEWGGRRPGISLDRDLQGFIAVLFVHESGDGGGLPASYRPGRAGDQRGLIEAGFEWENDEIRLHGYNQSPFETGIGIDVRNIDRLAGLTLEFKKQTGIRKILVEFIHTKQMEDYGREVHSYYNNGVYKTGWEYQERIIGTPLMTNRIRTGYYFPDAGIQPFDWDAPANSIPGSQNILNNRIVGLHLGLSSTLMQVVNSTTRFTYTKNYGTFQQTVYSPSKTQYYAIQEFGFHLPSTRFDLKVGGAFDFGDLSNNGAFILGANYRIL